MTHIAKKVHAYNEVNRIGRIYHQFTIDRLQPLMDKEILKVDGYMMKKYAFKFPDIKLRINKQFPDDYIQIHRVFLNFNMYSIWLKVGICAKDTKDTCFYQDVNIYVGSIKGQTLTELTTVSDPKRTTVKEQLTVKRRIEELQDKLNQLKYKLIDS